MDHEVAAVRAFSRFYTRTIGVLHEGLHGSPLSLAEGRVAWEIEAAGGDGTTATALRSALNLDGGYLSRILRRLEALGLIDRTVSDVDARQSVIRLTVEGRAAWAAIDTAAQTEVAALLDRLAPSERRRLVASLETARHLLGDATAGDITLRAHRAGEIGWIVHRQAAIYAQEYGLDASFEALLCEIGATFLREFEPSVEGCWIAERAGAILGSVSLVRLDESTAKLRMLYVEQAARGLGVGRRLLEACVGFAHSAGYRRITLWTNDILVAARALYASAGFRLISAEPPTPAFGRVMGSETWELDLASSR